MGAEDVHDETVVVLQDRIALGFVVHADEDQRRIERERCERAHGEAGRAPVAVGGRDDRDAAREVAEETTKIVGFDHRPFLAGHSWQCKISGE